MVIISILVFAFASAKNLLSGSNTFVGFGLAGSSSFVAVTTGDLVVNFFNGPNASRSDFLFSLVNFATTNLCKSILRQ